jgi:hypothetical protein
MASDQCCLLRCKQEILDYLGVSDEMFKTLVRAGMPVRYIGGRCFAHPDNLDEFFKAITRVSTKDVPEEAP